jgi:DNA invertase Pin-like site-specific DNA recombinase
MEIKDVAIYLRKSRDESNGEEDVLAKHERLLVDFVTARGWNYTIYKEIGSSDSLDARPQMMKLLDDVDDGYYQAVVVVDFDRLSRGDQLDQATIQRIFRKANTKIVTPLREYDLNDEQNEIFLGIESLFARYEYRMITRRLQRGKRGGAKQGKWTNGKPPYPYYYDRETKLVLVDEPKREIYNLIKQQVLDGVPCYQVAVELNRMGVPSPSGKHWSEVAIQRTVTSEVHLGRVVYGKTSGCYHKEKREKNPLKKNDRKDWIVEEGSHEPLKTPEEHARILEALERRRIIPKKARQSVYPLSGLIRCASCGYAHGFYQKENGRLMLKPCVHRDPLGNKCKNKGISASIIYEAVDSAIEAEIGSIMSASPEQAERPNLNPLLETKREELTALEAGMDRTQDLFIMGRLTREQVKERLEQHDELIRTKRNEIAQLEEMSGIGKLKDEERLERLQELKQAWHELDLADKEKNRIVKQIIDRIVYKRPTENEVDIQVLFL